MVSILTSFLSDPHHYLEPSQWRAEHPALPAQSNGGTIVSLQLRLRLWGPPIDGSPHKPARVFSVRIPGCSVGRRERSRHRSNNVGGVRRQSSRYVLPSYILFLRPIPAFLPLIHHLSSPGGPALSSSNHAANEANARGTLLIDRLQDLPNRIREIASHDVHHSAATALATAQTHIGRDL